MLKVRKGSGILLHISSLSSSYGIGDLGPSAYKFADYLYNNGYTYWQILPLNPIEPVYDYSPYSSCSAFAGNIYLISPEVLFKEELLSRKAIENHPIFNEKTVEYEKVINYKNTIFENSYRKYFKKIQERNDFQEFQKENNWWLNDYALYRVIKQKIDQQAWSKWQKDLFSRNPASLKEIEINYQQEIEKEKYLQYLFFKQWNNLKKYCNEKKIKIIGDIPIYVSYDSADVWTNREIFKIDSSGASTHVAGVPPDYFSKTGQYWGNPVYNWEVLSKTNYEWWIKRIEHSFKLFDRVRIDHFRGVVAYWEIPATETTAVKGYWVKAPADEFLSTVFKKIKNPQLIAEDLGVITPDVTEVMKKFSIPGMKVLLFAFGEDNPAHPYLPENYEPNCVAYTGTHDTNTIIGWYEEEAKKEEKKRLKKLLGKRINKKTLHIDMINLLMESRAETVIIPFQDILGLGSEARMNKPSTSKGNWRFRVDLDSVFQ